MVNAISFTSKKRVWKNLQAIRTTHDLTNRSALWHGQFFQNKIAAFVHTEELVGTLSNLTPKRAYAIARIQARFLDRDWWKHGKPHDGRAPDYDDWTTSLKMATRGRCLISRLEWFLGSITESCLQWKIVSMKIASPWDFVTGDLRSSPIRVAQKLC